ncbi:HCL513Wp [Eremothecium sinecaudum]|uniref:HCL513Wp n=1 Tax=Eremothecium sinecaudum TaxID=45286 RepID=A0A109UY17_9SACH|nr:HCL513Wp [Eremothecium sinecaudum]AMD19638.1 HCL513Wp [Eremothecium sinecaudum]
MILTVAEVTNELFKPYGMIASPDDEYTKVVDTCRSSGMSGSSKTAPVVKLPLLLNVDEPLKDSRWYFVRSYTKADLKRRFTSEKNTRKVKVSLNAIEKQPFSMQTFIPMGRGPEDIAYVVVVAIPDETGEPALNTLQAFACKGTQAITYNPGIWHSPIISVGDHEYLDFYVLECVTESGNPDEPGHVERVYVGNGHKIELYCYPDDQQ